MVGLSYVTIVTKEWSNISVSNQQRVLAAVLLRRLFTTNFETLWQQITVDMQTGVKQELMTAIHQETVASVRKKICDIFAELARNMIGNYCNR